MFAQVGAEPRRTRKTGYDGLGRRLRETDEAGVATDYRYDSLGRLKKVNPDTTAEDSPADATYTYDAVGNVQSTVYRNGVTSSYTYNERNWLRVLETSKSGVFARFDYDSAAAGANWPANRRLSPTGQRRQVTDLIGSASRTVTYDYTVCTVY